MYNYIAEIAKKYSSDFQGLSVGETLDKIEKDLGINDVIGNLTHEEVFKWLDKIKDYKEGV